MPRTAAGTRSAHDAIPTTNLKFWFRASSLPHGDGVSMGAIGPLVGPVFLQGTAANQPTFRLTGGPNSRAAIEFDGTADRLECGDATFTALLNGENVAHSCIAVAKVTTNSGGRAAFTFGNSGSANHFYEPIFATSDGLRTVIRGSDGVSVQAIAGSTLNTTDFFIMASRYDGTNGHLYTNGTFRTTNAMDPATVSGLNLATIGALRRSTNSDFWQGFISEILFYNTDIGNTSIIEIQQVLGRYYAITTS